MIFYLILSFLYQIIISNNFVFKTQGLHPNSITLKTTQVFTIDSLGVHIFQNEGTLISTHSYVNKTSWMEFAVLKDQSIVAFNGKEVFVFNKDGQYVKHFPYPFFENMVPQPSQLNYSVSDYTDQEFLVVANADKLYISVIDKELQTGIDHRFAIDPFSHVQCMKRITSKEIICSLIFREPSRSLGVILLRASLAAASLKKLPTNQAITVRMAKVSISFIFCYVEESGGIGCAIMNDNTLDLTPLFPISESTGNIKETQFDMTALSSREILIVYAYNVAPNYLRLQKINYQGKLIDSVTSIPIPQANTVITNLNIIAFCISDDFSIYGVAYGLVKEGLYFEELEISFCSDYCNNVDLLSTISINLKIYAFSPSITFTSQVSSGRLEQLGTEVTLNTQYSTLFPFSFTSGNVKEIATAHFHTENANGVMSHCIITLFIGEKGNCSCRSPYFKYQNECVRLCPQYAYVDHSNQECINCATIGKYFYQNKCLSKDEINFNGVYVVDIAFNAVEDCEPPCMTCVERQDNCLSCYPGLVCQLNCPQGYFHSIAEGRCVKCYETCAICSDLGNETNHKCRSCIIGYQEVAGFPKLCIQICIDASSERWFIDDNQKYHCINSIDCPADRPIYTKENNQCVESCSKLSTCLFCLTTTQMMYNHMNRCVLKCPEGTVPNEKDNQCEKAPGLDIEITDKPLNETLNDLNISIITKPNSTVIKGDDFVIEIINTTDKGGNLQLSQIDFSKCEAVLRKQYSIPPGEVLYIVKLDLDRKDEVSSQVEYEVYDSKGVKLDLKYCDNITIDVVYQIKNNSFFDKDLAKEYELKGIDIYNPKDPFFTEICYPFSTVNGTDITLKDRLKDIYTNVSLCEENCEYKAVDLDDMTISCECNVKPKLNTEISSNFFIQGLTSAFTDSNFMVVTCYNLVFDTRVIVSNAAFWFYFVLAVLHAPSWLIYFIYGTLPIRKYIIASLPKSPPLKKIPAKDYIDKILYDGQKEESEDEKSKESNEEDNYDNVMEHNEKKAEVRKQSLFKGQTKEETKDCESEFEDTPSPKQPEVKTKMINDNITQSIALNSLKKNVSKELNHKTRGSTSSLKTYNSNFLFNQSEKNELNISKDVEIHDKSLTKTIKNKSRNIRSDISAKIDFKGDKSKVSEKEQLNDSKFFSKDKRELIITTALTENQQTLSPFSNEKVKAIKPSLEVLDDFDLISAKMYDNRSFWRLMYICLLTKHPILSTFVKKYYFSLRTIVIIQFIFGNAMDFAFNAFFYTDDLISQRYNYEGNLGLLFTLQNNIVTSIASLAVSLLLGFFLNYLASSENQFEAVQRQVKEKKKYTPLLKKTVTCFKWKVTFFLLLELLLMLFFWYYAMAFCAVYQNSQISWLTGGLITFAIGLLFPIPIALAIVLVRYCAVAKQKNCIFKTTLWFYRL